MDLAVFGDVASKVLVVGGVVWSLVESVKPIWDKTKRENIGDKVAALIFGVGICVAAPVDLFPAIGIPLAVPFVGSVLTGVLMVGGAKAAHDLVGLVNAARVARGGG